MKGSGVIRSSGRRVAPGWLGVAEAPGWKDDSGKARSGGGFEMERELWIS